MEQSAAEIHAYPQRPDGFEEPLFPTRASRLAVAEHLLRAPWLSRASEAAGPEGGDGRTVRRQREPIEFGDGTGGISWASGRERRRKRRRVVETLDRCREVGWWWDESARVDRLVLKVLLSDKAVVELARERPGGWFLVGVED